MKTLENTLRKAFYALGLAGALAACGDTYYNYGGNSSGSSSGNPQGYCGNSPLYGKYLWQVGECEAGSVKPFDENCKGYWGGDVSEKNKICSYYGMTVTWADYSMTLTKNISCSGLEENGPNYSNPKKNCLQIYCKVQHGTDIYGNLNDDYHTNDSAYWLQSSPWPGRDACGAQIMKEEWRNSCPYQ
ncbi:MAG: hypothetical protein AB1668_04435 [Nanoarchaeota archaeon]